MPYIIRNGKEYGGVNVSTASTTSYTAPSSGSTVGKTNVQDAVDALNSNLADYVPKSDIVNNLTSTDTNKPLSANQGKLLSDKLPLYTTYTSSNGFNWNSCSNVTFRKYGKIVHLTIVGYNNTSSDIISHLTGVPLDCLPADMYNIPYFATAHVYSGGYGYCKDVALKYYEAEGYKLISLATSGDISCVIPAGYRYYVQTCYIARD